LECMRASGARCRAAALSPPPPARGTGLSPYKRKAVTHKHMPAKQTRNTTGMNTAHTNQEAPFLVWVCGRMPGRDGLILEVSLYVRLTWPYPPSGFAGKSREVSGSLANQEEALFFSLSLYFGPAATMMRLVSARTPILIHPGVRSESTVVYRQHLYRSDSICVGDYTHLS
jgi:hypothetical protein